MTTRILLPSFTLFAISILITPAQADHYQTIFVLAQDVRDKSLAAIDEIDHQGGGPQFRHLRNDILEMKRLAARVHRKAHSRADICEIRFAVEELDEAYRHVARQTSQFESRFRYAGSPTFGAPCQLTAIMNDIRTCVNALRSEVRYLIARTSCRIPNGRDWRADYGYGSVFSGYDEWSLRNRLAVPGFNHGNDYPDRGLRAGYERLSSGNDQFRVNFRF